MSEIVGTIRLDDPSIDEATTLSGVYSHGIKNGKTIRIPMEDIVASKEYVDDLIGDINDILDDIIGE